MNLEGPVGLSGKVLKLSRVFVTHAYECLEYFGNAKNVLEVMGHDWNILEKARNVQNATWPCVRVSNSFFKSAITKTGQYLLLTEISASFSKRAASCIRLHAI